MRVGARAGSKCANTRISRNAFRANHPRRAVGSGLHSSLLSEKACAGLPHSIHEQRTIKVQVTYFAARLRNEETAVTGRAV